MKWKLGALSAGKVCEVEKTVRFYSLGTSLTSRASTDTVTNREKDRLQFLYPLPKVRLNCPYSVLSHTSE